MTSRSPNSCTPPPIDGDQDSEVIELTPFKPTQSLGSSALMSERAERLGRELDGYMVDSDGDICNKFYNELCSEFPVFGSVPWDKMAGSLQAYNSDDDNPWSAWLKNPSQENFDIVLQILCEMLHSAVKDTDLDRPLKKRILFVGNKIVPSSALRNTSKHPPKPDFITIEGSLREGQGWRYYETLWEHKSSEDEKEGDDLICRLVARLVQAMRDCPFRRFVVGVVVQRTKFRPIIVDATGCCRFLWTDIVQETAKFIQFVASLLFLRRPYLGYDNDNIPEKGSAIPVSLKDCQLLADPDPLCHPTPDRIVGRGTHVYWARSPNTPSSEYLLIKECWQEFGREKEEDILEGLQDVAGVPRLLFQANPDLFDTTEKIRRGFVTYKQYHFTQKSYAKERGDSMHGTSSTHSTSEMKEDEAKGKRKWQENESRVTRKRSCRTGDQPDFSILPRRLCRIVTDYYGAHLDAAEHSDSVLMTDIERLRALRDVLNTIKDALSCGHPTIHRDISLRNIAVWRVGRPHSRMDIDSKQIGFLLDWDMGKTVGPDWKPLKPSSGRARAGTWHYIATNICRSGYDGYHLPWYDAESVFWVWLLFLVKRAKFQKDQMEKLNTAKSLSAMSDHRSQFIIGDFWEDLRSTASIHPSLRQLLSDLRSELFFSGGQGPSFRYQALKWSQTKQNVKDRLEYLADLFEKCAAELDKEDKPSTPEEG